MESDTAGWIGHNSQKATVRVTVRLFNSLSKYAAAEGPVMQLELLAGATVGDVVTRLRLPVLEIFLVLRNGRDVTPGPYQGGVINAEVPLEDGDALAFSGPVPYSYGYGAPVV
jgi:hypothetical protein